MSALRLGTARCTALLVVVLTLAQGQTDPSGATQTQLALERLNVLGSVLMIGAHPDDENTALLSYLAQGKKVRTAYLSITRGEGGQNLIGAELGDLLGIIRTQELLSARRIDGAEQYFTRAVDFGFSKSAEETLDKWGREAVLSDIVWRIRAFRPDIIVTQFTGTANDGHGHHQAAGILAREAFAAAADEKRFPEQLDRVQPWQAKRLLQSVYRFRAVGDSSDPPPADLLAADIGEYSTVLGRSFTEMAGLSRSMHRSQGMGAAERRGASRSYFSHVAGEPAKTSVFDGIDTSWNRVAGGAEVGRLLEEAARSFEPESPEDSIPALLEARELLVGMEGPYPTQKLAELESAIALCTGLWLDATSDVSAAIPGSTLGVAVEVLNRSHRPMQLRGMSLEGMAGTSNSEPLAVALAYNMPVTRELSVAVPADEAFTQPLWFTGRKRQDSRNITDQEAANLAESPAVLRARFRLNIDGQDIEFVRPVHYRYIERAGGERTRPFTVIPPVSVRLSEAALVFPDAAPRKLDVEISSNAANAAGVVSLELPDGWRCEPCGSPFRIPQVGDSELVSFEITPPSGQARGEVRAVAVLNNREVDVSVATIDYPHIVPQTALVAATGELVRADIRTSAKRVAYVMGAGDEVPKFLQQLGCEITFLGPEQLAGGDLSAFDVIVTGVRAYNVRPDLRTAQRRLLDYVERGGTLIVQYVTFDRRNPDATGGIGPYPFSVGSGRVSTEQAPVTFPNPEHPLLHTPNVISPEDFEGWVQERGLYFASEWDPRYETLFESHDPTEDALAGGTLVTRYGKGAYVFTAYSWFRQLPAGVPGAFRIFANLLSAGDVLR